MVKRVTLSVVGSLVMAALLSFAPAAMAQQLPAAACEIPFKRPFYKTRQAFCAPGEVVEDAHNPGVKHPCQLMEVDHLISLRFAHRNGVCDPIELGRLARDDENLRLTHWQTNRAKGTLSPEEFAIKRLSPELADQVIADAAQLRRRHGVAAFALTSAIQAQWLLEERDSLRRENNRLIENASALRNRQVTYRGQRMRAASAVSNHASRVTRRTTLATMRNFGSMAAEATPFVGVAAIVGVTALELRDACEVLKDVQELNLAFNPEATPADEVKVVCGLEMPSQDELLASVRQSPGEAWKAAKSLTPTLPEIGSIEVDWRSSLGTVKSGADWIADETKTSSADLLKAMRETWLELPELRLPWGLSDGD